jgi:hypothetical protein
LVKVERSGDRIDQRTDQLVCRIDDASAGFDLYLSNFQLDQAFCQALVTGTICSLTRLCGRERLRPTTLCLTLGRNSATRYFTGSLIHPLLAHADCIQPGIERVGDDFHLSLLIRGKLTIALNQIWPVIRTSKLLWLIAFL